MQRVEGGAPGCRIATSLRPASAEAMFESMDSCHSPSRVKMCDGMWSACGEDGAILA